MTSSSRSGSSKCAAVSATVTASPVPRGTVCSMNSTGIESGSCGASAPRTASAPRPTTTMTRSSGSADSESTTCSNIGLPHSVCSTFGVRERMRVPSPAASTIAEIGRYGLTALLPGNCACSVVGCEAARTRLALGGRDSNPDLRVPKTRVLPLHHPRIGRLHRSGATLLRGADSPPSRMLRYRRCRHGKPDQEAPQAHAQEEAQEASQEDALAAPHPGQVRSAQPAALLRFER